MIALAPDGVRIDYESHGSGPAVILIHGTTATRDVWRFQVAAYAERFRVLTFDMRGSGLSEVPADPALYGAAQMAADAAAVLDAAGVADAHVAGISVGGGVATTLALDFPDRVRSLHVAGGWARPDEFLRRIYFEPMAAGVERGDTHATFRYGMALMMSPTYLETRRPAAVAELISDVFVRRPVTLPGFRGQLSTGRDIDLVDRLPEVRVPTLVTAGEHDANIPSRYTRQLADLIPGARFELFRGPLAAHCPNIEMPEEFNRMTTEFMLACDAAAAP